MRKTSAVLAAVATFVLVGGVAAASIPDSSGVIHGCRKTNGGDVKVIDTATTTTCPGGFVPLNWNQTGPQGPAGAQGPVGPTGVQRSIAGGGGPLAPWEDRRFTLTCPVGQAVISGGWRAADSIHVYSSQPQVAPVEAWVFDVVNHSVNLGSIDLFAVCTAVQ